jgi:phosphoglycolate phosphatase-like HAD superfamily hydrolase
MTDRLIVRKGLEALGLSAQEAAIDQVLEDYLETLADEVERAERYFVHPGMLAALEALKDRPGVALGLGTGNLEAGARIKLERVQLNHYFSFGGFGCDAEDRNALILEGAWRGAKLLERSLKACRVVIIGDTPRDVEAARFVGGECIAVATGGATWEELEQTRPDWLFENLEADGALEALLG